MNDDKTEFIIFGSNTSSIRVGDSHVTHTYCVKPRLHGHAIFACVNACDIGFK